MDTPRPDSPQTLPGRRGLRSVAAVGGALTALGGLPAFSASAAPVRPVGSPRLPEGPGRHHRTVVAGPRRRPLDDHPGPPGRQRPPRSARGQRPRPGTAVPHRRHPVERRPQPDPGRHSGDISLDGTHGEAATGTRSGRYASFGAEFANGLRLRGGRHRVRQRRDRRRRRGADLLPELPKPDGDRRRRHELRARPGTGTCSPTPASARSSSSRASTTSGRTPVSRPGT